MAKMLISAKARGQRRGRDLLIALFVHLKYCIPSLALRVVILVLVQCDCIHIRL